MSTSGVVIAGLPGTGKTTYLALLYHAIVEERADGLRLGRYDDDREYITEIADVLLAGDVAEHTRMDDEREVKLSLSHDGKDFVLTIPDLSGETWEHALVDRRWPQSLENAIANAEGFIVFVHSNEINGGTSIVEARQAAAALLDDDEMDGHAGDGTAQSPEDGAAHEERTHAWDDALDENDSHENDEETHCKQLTQVSLVELLQFFASRSGRPIRVGVVLSAWDLQPEALTPQTWLTKNLPLLSQYLSVNDDEVDARVFGISAQGGDLTIEEVRVALLAEDPITRARAKAADGTDAGIAAPLRWVLRLDQ